MKNETKGKIIKFISNFIGYKETKEKEFPRTIYNRHKVIELNFESEMLPFETTQDRMKSFLANEIANKIINEKLIKTSIVDISEGNRRLCSRLLVLSPEQ